MIIHGGIDLGAVKDQEGFHGSVPHALVAIDERVAMNQREAQGYGLLNQRRIEIDAAESGLGLGDGGLKRAKISNARCAAGRLEEAAM